MQLEKYAVVNLFRKTVNDVRKLSTNPVRHLTTVSGKGHKNVNQNQEKTAFCYSATVLQLIFGPNYTKNILYIYIYIDIKFSFDFEHPNFEL